MDNVKIFKSWNSFKKYFPEVTRRDRFMQINFDFHLGPAFHKEDLDEMIKFVNLALDSIKKIEVEMQK